MEICTLLNVDMVDYGKEAQYYFETTSEAMQCCCPEVGTKNTYMQDMVQITQ